MINKPVGHVGYVVMINLRGAKAAFRIECATETFDETECVTLYF